MVQSLYKRMLIPSNKYPFVASNHIDGNKRRFSPTHTGFPSISLLQVLLIPQMLHAEFRVTLSQEAE
jgi:hypothetical protein